MPLLVPGKVFTPEVVTPSKMNQIMDTLAKITFAAAGKVLGRSTGSGAGDWEEISYGSMMQQNSDAVSISGGNAALSVLTVERITPDQETGYPTSGAIPLDLNGDCRAYIALAGNATFSVVGPSPGFELIAILKNTSGGAITLTWPAWTVVKGKTLPTSIANGEAISLKLTAVGTHVVNDIVADL